MLPELLPGQVPVHQSLIKQPNGGRQLEGSRARILTTATQHEVEETVREVRAVKTGELRQLNFGRLFFALVQGAGRQRRR